MATWWVDPVSGSDGFDGMTPSTAFATIGAGLAKLNSAPDSPKGSILNLMDTGPHDWPTVEVQINNANFSGTDYDTDPGCIIRGRTSGDLPAFATLVPASAGAHSFIEFRSPCKYVTVENLIFDSTAFYTDGTPHGAIRARDSGQGPVRVRYCQMLGAPTGNLSVANRTLFSVPSSPADPDQGIIEYCYIQNALSPFTGPYRTIKFRYNVWINDSGIGNSTYLLNNSALLADDTDRVLSMYNNTVYNSAGSDAVLGLFNQSVSAGVDCGEVNSYNNVYWADSTGAINPFMACSAAVSPGIFYTGIISPNILIMGPNLSIGDLSADEWYQEGWDHDQNDATGVDPYPNDSVAYGVADSALFNDVTSTYDWELPNGLICTILMDLRLIQYTTAGYFGDLPGALPSVSSGGGGGGFDDEDDPAAIPFLDVAPFYTSTRRLEINAAFKTTQNRQTGDVLRKDVENKAWREFSSQLIKLDPSTTIWLRSGIENAEFVLVESDTQVQLNAGKTEDVFLPESEVVFVGGGEYTFRKVKNTSASDTATFLFAETD